MARKINWDISYEDAKLLDAIVQRAKPILKGLDVSPIDFMMDIQATHANGCQLDLQKFLDSPKYDFTHDLFGIHRHINRKNGTLGGCFLPRCAHIAEVSHV